MLNLRRHKPTIGFICTWPVYQGTTIDRYAHSLIQGISAAAHKHGCDLLLGCGFSATGNNPQYRSFWPVPGPNVNFVPVGPWNTDGLIIVPDELTKEQSQYVRDLLESGFPVIFTTPEGPGPVVAVDNTLGILQAFEHLLQHGHKQIAFIAGHIGQGGDSEERLQAYRLALKQAGLPEDPRLIAFGEHRRAGGRFAMQQILNSGATFTGLIASNDLSCLGAIQCLQEAGRLIPDDVAVIGFDDILDAQSLSPSLTTIRHPTFSLGYQSVVTLLDHICNRADRASRVVVPPRLMIRQSCGCPPTGTGLSFPSIDPFEPALQLSDLARAMAEASLSEARNSLVEDLQEQCTHFLDAFVRSLRLRDANAVLGEIKRVLAWTDERDEDAHVWQTGIAILYQKMHTLLHLAPQTDQAFTTSLIDRVHLEISDQIQRRTTRSMIEHMDMMSQLGMMTAELLAAMNISESAEILTRHLPEVGILNLLVALYDHDGDDHTSQATILFTAGLPGISQGQRFETRRFPTPEIYPAETPVQLTILPLDVDGKTFGFAAFNAPNPELCAAIVHNLSAALRTSQLYNDAVEGRRMAEEANHLKSRFLSMVSHELRTPLSLIVGLSEMVLREGQPSQLPRTTLRDMEQINISAQHLARLIGDVLDLASSEAGQLHILREPLDLADVLRVAAKIGEELAHEKGLAWSVQLPQQGPWVMGDRTRLRQVTLNLISNAVKFTPAGQVHLAVSIRDKDATVSISDTGMGISPNEQSTIFDEFYRSRSAIESGYGGLGLGLAISKELIEQHGGHIEVRSPGDLGSGSTFSFCLPIISEIEATAGLLHLPTAAASLVVLLAEGNESTTELSEYLKLRGFDVDVCLVDEDSEWLSKIVQTAPSAIILEEHLASREGWAIIGMLKRQSATENIPVVAYSLNPEHDQGQMLELNYLHKPLKPDQLIKELERFKASAGPPQTVLVVDDDPGILEMHSRLIEQTGRRILTARNGREALILVEQKTPDLILLDLMMPEMDGFAVLDELQAKESTRSIPVIILTARLLSDADLERCNRGVASILGKGLFTTEETLRHVEAALMRQHTLSRATKQLVRKAMTYMHARYAEPITREGIADHIGISADYLTDCFRQELGITPITYIRRYRIREACELLRNTDQSITQIAMAVGFSDSAHFTRTFQREVGMTPRAYRDSKRV
ncbi:MAG TPA: substrate-binding domain-containing protein [Anaerolineales bacterium]|nr:substrate-binding domain-containing protein [Anaerolineales bacterium]